MRRIIELWGRFKCGVVRALAKIIGAVPRGDYNSALHDIAALGAEVSELRSTVGSLNDEVIRLTAQGDELTEEVERTRAAHAATTAGLRFAENQLVLARDRQYLAEEKVSRIRDIVSGRDLRIEAHQTQPEKEGPPHVDQQEDVQPPGQ
jgi:chromosome segregation ATPase